MRLILIVFNLILFTSILKAQYFEGEITYEVKYYHKKKLQKREIDYDFGKKIKLFIKNDRYRIQKYRNDEESLHSIYNPQTKKLLETSIETPFAVWTNCAVEKDTIVSLEVSKETTKYKDYECQILILETVNKTEMMLVSNQFKVNPNLFSTHKFGFISEILEKTQGSIFLERIVETQDYEIRMSMTSFTRRDLSDTLFMVAEEKALFPSTNELQVQPDIQDKMYKKLSNMNLIHVLKKNKVDVVRGSYLFLYCIIDENGELEKVNTFPNFGENTNLELLEKIRKREIRFTPAQLNDKKVSSLASLILILN